jgi:hypothetical protein
MRTIDTDQGLSPAALFMENAGTDLNRVKIFILEAIECSLKVGEAAKAPFEHTINIDVCNPDSSIAFKLPLHIAVDKAAVASEILHASLRNKLRFEGLHVVEGFFMQPRLVLLIRRRVVGHLYCSRDGQNLQLDIKARPDARDMGNAVLALGPLKYNGTRRSARRLPIRPTDRSQYQRNEAPMPIDRELLHNHPEAAKAFLDSQEGSLLHEVGHYVAANIGGMISGHLIVNATAQRAAAAFVPDDRSAQRLAADFEWSCLRKKFAAPGPENIRSRNFPSLAKR